MGNREDLIAGARRCLFEKGYARTTARDIAAASGTSLAAIGYHFGSKEELLNTALFEATDAGLGEEFDRALGDAAAAADPLKRFEATWTHLIESFPEHEQLLVASLENLGQLARVPQVRELLAAAGIDAMGTFAQKYQHTEREAEAEVDDESARSVGALYYVLMNGLIVQWMADPDSVPSGRDLARALRTITRDTASAAPESEPEDAHTDTAGG